MLFYVSLLSFQFPLMKHLLAPSCPPEPQQLTQGPTYGDAMCLLLSQRVVASPWDLHGTALSRSIYPRSSFEASGSSWATVVQTPPASAMAPASFLFFEHPCVVAVKLRTTGLCLCLFWFYVPTSSICGLHTASESFLCFLLWKWEAVSREQIGRNSHALAPLSFLLSPPVASGRWWAIGFAVSAG